MFIEENDDLLSVVLIQTDLYWENTVANLSALEEKIAGISEQVDLIVLPEMFNTGFSMNTAFAEPMNLTTTKWMKHIAAQARAMVIGSFAVREGTSFYNRVCCAKPDGTLEYADKRHLFRMGEEHQNYTRGEKKLIVEWKGWKITPLICYDLRFPVWSRNLASDPYDLLIYVANWPAARAFAWNTLLAARAIENQSYVIGVNRVGADGKGVEHRGDSTVLDFLGEPLVHLGNSESMKVLQLSKSRLKQYRSGFPAYLDADNFSLH
jgi:omega-amidase